MIDHARLYALALVRAGVPKLIFAQLRHAMEQVLSVSLRLSRDSRIAGDRDARENHAAVALLYWISHETFVRKHSDEEAEDIDHAAHEVAMEIQQRAAN